MNDVFRELKRRNVYRVAVTYVIVAFVGLQAVDLLIPATTLPAWADELLVALAVFGFPVAIVVAWAFEMTPEGVRRTADAGGESGAEAPLGARRSRSRRALGALVALGLVGAAVAGGWYLVGGGGEPEPGPRAGDRSIAVLPFEALGQAEPDVFTEGMHDDLLARLSNVAGLKVISRTSVQQYRGTDKTTAEIAGELGVRWVLEGGVQEMGDQIQVNAQLIDPRTDTHAWADSYRRDLTAASLFDLQSEITKRIARSLEAELTTEEAERVERRPTDDLDAYRLYVRGRTHLDRRTEEGMRRGKEFFRRALGRDSSYALAWAGLADARSLLASYGHASRDSSYREALDAAERALELDPDLAEARASLGLIRKNLRGDGPGALREFRRAVDLKPSYARAHHWLGLLLSTLGRPEQARAPLGRAAELDPMSPPIHATLAVWHYHADSLERALQEARRAGRLSPGYPTGPLYEGIVLSRLGRQGQAVAVLRRTLEEAESGSAGRIATRAWLAVAHYRAGDTTRARALLDRLEEQQADFEAGLVRAEMGDHDAAISRLSGARPDYARTIVLRCEPLFDPLREDPRFQELIREVNRSWGLNPDGSLPEEAGS